MPSTPTDRPHRQAAIFTRQESIGYQVNLLARLLASELRSRIEPHGVVPGQFAQLLTLLEGDGTTQAELCEQVQLDQSTMAHTLNRMERDGLIERSPDPHDRRRARIQLSARAHALAPTLVEAAVDVNGVAAHGLSDDDVATFRRVVDQMIDNLRAAGASGAER